MIKLNNVSFGYTGDSGALKNINISVRNGECILLFGESSCGKTTINEDSLIYGGKNE